MRQAVNPACVCSGIQARQTTAGFYGALIFFRASWVFCVSKMYRRALTIPTTQEAYSPLLCVGRYSGLDAPCGNRWFYDPIRENPSIHFCQRKNTQGERKLSQWFYFFYFKCFLPPFALSNRICGCIEGSLPNEKIQCPDQPAVACQVLTWPSELISVGWECRANGISTSINYMDT